MVASLIAFIAVLTTLYYLWTKTNSSNDKGTKQILPPSPPRLPVLGNIHQLIKQKKTKELHQIITDYSKDLGSIFTFWFGDRPMVFINDYRMAKEMLNSSECSGRPQRLAGQIVSKNFQGLVVTDDLEKVKQRRKIIHKALSFYEKNNLEENLQEETDELIETIRKEQKCNQYVSLNQKIALFATNIFMRFLFNKRCKGINGTFTTIQKLLEMLSKGLTISNLLAGFPILRKLPLGKVMFLDLYVKGMFGLIGKEYEQHKSKLPSDETNGNSDLTDILINEDSNLTRDNIEVLLSDTMVAGIDTTMSAMKLTVYNLAKYTTKAEICFKEIQGVLVDKKNMTLEESQKCHYLRAFLHESLRTKDVSPLGVPHRAQTDIEIEGYTIPKNTTVFFNLYAMHNDESLFEEPHSFKPERFLNTEGEFVQNEKFVGFSIGRRRCIGQHFATKSLVYTLAKLVQTFELELPTEGIYQAKIKYETTMKVKNLHLKMKERQDKIYI
ncbi:uncharacterized protein [Clytia hemisphaerica]|uniref:uncharacterized protein n=1 Tax=Clytia hemisphaerica TaxID=252671 RepID=UPI0034D6EC18